MNINGNIKIISQTWNKHFMKSGFCKKVVVKIYRYINIYKGSELKIHIFYQLTKFVLSFYIRIEPNPKCRIVLPKRSTFEPQLQRSKQKKNWISHDRENFTKPSKNGINCALLFKSKYFSWSCELRFFFILLCCDHSSKSLLLSTNKPTFWKTQLLA